MISATRQTFLRTVLDAVDLAIDFATLGEYGLELRGERRPGSACANGPCGERRGREAAWEALATARSRHV